MPMSSNQKSFMPVIHTSFLQSTKNKILAKTDLTSTTAANVIPSQDRRGHLKAQNLASAAVNFRSFTVVSRN